MKLIFLIITSVILLSACKKESIEVPYTNIKIITDTIYTDNDLNKPSLETCYHGIEKLGYWGPSACSSDGFCTTDLVLKRNTPSKYPIFLYKDLLQSELNLNIESENTIDVISKKPNYIIYPNNLGFFQFIIPSGKYYFVADTRDDSITTVHNTYMQYLHITESYPYKFNQELPAILEGKQHEIQCTVAPSY